VADLRKELISLKKVLLEERGRSEADEARVSEAQALFAKVFGDYLAVIEALKQAGQRKKMEAQHEEIKAESYHEMTDKLTAKVLQAEEQLREERVRVKVCTSLS